MNGLVKPEIKFGTSGWRGIISDDFTAGNLAIAIQGVANYIKKTDTKNSGLVVGYDTRFMSDRFALITCNILKRNNISVLLTKRDTPTPVIAFYILKSGKFGALNITASHNPPEYNGVKFSTSYGGPAPSEVTKEIEKEIEKIQSENLTIPYSSGKEGIETFDPEPRYLKHMSKLIDLNVIKKSKIKIAVDCMYGTSRGYLDFIIEKTGIKPIVLHNYLDPNFGGGNPCPSSEFLKDLTNTVIKSKRQLGLATDGDADRFGIIDRDGSFLPANYTLALVLEHLLKTRKHKGGIVRSITTTHLLDAIAKRFGREVYEVPVGFKYVGTALNENNALIGCEESGGMTIAGHVPEKDGILACLLVTELISVRKKSLKELIKEIISKYGRFYSTRNDIRLKPEQKEQLISNLKNNPLKELGGIKISSYKVLPGDNFKMEFPDGSWIIVRPSGTEPLIRCYIETLSPKTLTLLDKELLKLIS